MKIKNLILVLGVSVVLAVVLGVTGNYLYERHLNDQARSIELVQLVCDNAHNEINGASEQACGLAQDQTHTEYLCDHYKNVPDVCYVEAK